MKVHYINILLFALPLNLLEYNQRNHYITRTPKATTRTLCECELYAKSNYDNDQEMINVIKEFNNRTAQRFEEYNERLLENKQKCKEQCDKEIQKIILKDRLEKELMDKFATLHTDIQSDAIPTCVCEKSIADKVEKGCLKCAQNLGGIVAPSSGVLGGIGEFGLSVWKPAALAAAKEFAEKAGAAAGKAAGEARGMEIVLHYLEGLGVEKLVPDICKKVSSTGDYTHVINFANDIYVKYGETCFSVSKSGARPAACEGFELKFGIFRIDGRPGPPANEAIPQVIKKLVGEATQGANAKAAMVASDKTLAVETAKKNAIETTFMGYHNAIIASVVAILIIVLIMLIIYLILRYRRKKKMKKKLQYIKLLEE
ncbi:rifin [Plasmodium falciparum RAJ116]|uniref:Rifin n=1 Tax=Plasmodium falciparum RAJ116 TaxID=580058 RepID=A0A0L0CS78_PLAFA|nr:rifin [Plasmodium falciparum RAJ116]